MKRVPSPSLLLMWTGAVLFVGIVGFIGENVARNGSEAKGREPSTDAPFASHLQPVVSGRLTTDVHLREFADPNAPIVGTHYEGAQFDVLEIAPVLDPHDGVRSIWYHVHVTSYGHSRNAAISTNRDPGSDDEGWINSFPRGVTHPVVTFEQ